MASCLCCWGLYKAGPPSVAAGHQHKYSRTAFQFQSCNLELRGSRCGRFVTIERCFHSVFKGILIQFGVSPETWLAFSKHSPHLILPGQLPVRAAMACGDPGLVLLLFHICSYFTFSHGWRWSGPFGWWRNEGRGVHVTWGALKRQRPPGCLP